MLIKPISKAMIYLYISSVDQHQKVNVHNSYTYVLNLCTNI
jgi:hypothetical protein